MFCFETNNVNKCEPTRATFSLSLSAHVGVHVATDQRTKEETILIIVTQTKHLHGQ